jgi:hypothetical protein
MGQTQLTRHSCGYALVREEVIDSVDVGSGLHLPSELQATLRRDQYTECCYLPVGTLLYCVQTPSVRKTDGEWPSRSHRDQARHHVGDLDTQLAEPALR